MFFLSNISWPKVLLGLYAVNKKCGTRWVCCLSILSVRYESWQGIFFIAAQ